MERWFILLALATAAIATSPGASVDAAVSSPPTLSLAFRTWTFGELGFPPTTYRHPRGWDRPAFSYRLPRTVEEGKNGWWIITLHMRLETRPVPSGRTAIIAAATNQVGCAYVRLTSVVTPRGPAVRWTTVGIVTGMRTGIVARRSFDLSFSNYLAVPGVVAGTNELEWIAEDKGLLARATILPTSSLQHSRLAPARVSARVIVGSAVRVGERFPVVVLVRNRGGMAARNVAVVFDLGHGVFGAVGPRRHVVRTLPRGRPVRVRFTVRALVLGRHALDVSVSSSSNTTSALAYVSVER